MGFERCFGEPRFGGRGDGERAGAGVLVLGAAEELVPLGVTLVTIFSRRGVSRPPYLILRAKLCP